MLTLTLESFQVELDEGAIQNVGASNKTAAVTLYDATDAEARAFGDRRVKIAVEDESGNQVELALDPATARALAADLESVVDDLE